MYFGSVRFFKNLILLAVIILIAVPAVTAFRLHGSLEEQRAETGRLAGELTEAEIRLADAEREIAEAAVREAESVQEAAEAADTADDSPEAPAYQSLYPDFYAPEPYHATERVTGAIFLTFDDGPSSNTPRLLEVLDRQDVKATFFVIGQSDETNLERMREIVARGHSLGMHSYSHDYAKIYGSVEAYLDDIYQIFTQIRETTGQTPVLFRFPGGSINSYNAGIYQELIAEMIRRGFVPCDWNLSGDDAIGTDHSVSKITENVLRNIGSVRSGYVLLHDGGYATTTAQAVDRIIDELRSRGFQFEALTPEKKPILFGYESKV